jgi:protein-disulfide isomerase
MFKAFLCFFLLLNSVSFSLTMQPAESVEEQSVEQATETESAPESGEQKKYFYCDRNTCVSSNYEPGPTVKPCHSNFECFENKRCRDGICLPGIANDVGLLCGSDLDCKVKSCNRLGQCTRGGGGKTCNNSEECVGKHCDGQSCVPSRGNIPINGGRCNSDDDCGSGSPISDRICDPKGLCVWKKDGEQGHGCASNADCIGTTCFRETCMRGGFGGGIGCDSNKDCTPEATKSCAKGSCVIMDGPKNSLCNTDEECKQGVWCYKGMCKKWDWATQGSDPSCIDRNGNPMDGKACRTDVRLSTDVIMGSSLDLKKIKAAKTALNKSKVNAMIGSKTAPITLALFQDLKCGMCKKTYKEAIEKIKQDYVDKGQVKIVFYEFPIGNMALEKLFAHGALCANEEGKYLEYAQGILNDIKDSNQNSVQGFAEKLNLNLASFKKCMASEKYSKTISNHIEIGKTLKVEGTPTYFVNGIQILGAQPYATFKEAIDSELKRLSGKTKKTTKKSKKDV